MRRCQEKLDSYFNITKSGSTVRIEIMAGIATFMTMSYILLVNSGMLGVVASFNAIFIATAISSIIGTLMMALYAKLPFAQAPGMGLNAFFLYTVIFTLGLSYGNALVVVLISGVIFLILTVVGIREKIVQAIPMSLRLGIPAGIGLFIAFIGFQNAGIIVGSPATLVTLVNFRDIFHTELSPGLGYHTIHSIMGAIITLLTFIVIAALSKKKVRGSILYGILIGAIIYYTLQYIIFGEMGSFIPYDEGNPELTGIIAPFSLNNPFTAFSEFGRLSLFKLSFRGLFTNGFSSVITFITLVVSFAIVDMFDTIGTLVGTAKKANLLRPDGTMHNMRKALLSDSVATVTGSLMGTSTVTTYVESSAGISVGGRTGLTSLTVAFLFLIAMLLTPIAILIPSYATAAALIYIGVLMIGSLAELDFTDPAVVAPAFITAIGMPLTYSIADGIGLGILTYVLIKLFIGKVKEVHFITYIIALIFILKFFIL